MDFIKGNHKLSKEHITTWGTKELLRIIGFYQNCIPNYVLQPYPFTAFLQIICSS